MGWVYLPGKNQNMDQTPCCLNVIRAWKIQHAEKMAYTTCPGVNVRALKY